MMTPNDAGLSITIEAVDGEWRVASTIRAYSAEEVCEITALAGGVLAQWHAQAHLTERFDAPSRN